MSVNLRDHSWRLRSRKSVPYTPTSASRSSSHAWRVAVPDVRPVVQREDDPNRAPPSPAPTDGRGCRRCRRGGSPSSGSSVHLDLGDQVQLSRRDSSPTKSMPACLADQAASSVAADEVLRSERTCRRTTRHRRRCRLAAKPTTSQSTIGSEPPSSPTHVSQRWARTGLLPRVQVRSCGGWGSR